MTTLLSAQPRIAFFRMGCFSLSVVIALAIQALHILALPLVVSYDGHLYYELAGLFGSGRFWQEFDFLRTPLIPLLLRASFEVIGEQSSAVLFLNGIFGFVSTLAIGLAVRLLVGDRAGALSVLLLSFFPLSVAYQHVFLTESGAGCAIAALAASLLYYLATPTLSRAVLLSLVITGGYYLRPTFLYLAPTCVALIFFDYVTSPVRYGALRNCLVAIVVVCTIPFIASAPWRVKTAESGRVADMYVFGMLKQSLVGVDDVETLGTQQTRYTASVERVSQAGMVDIGGLLNGDALDITWGLAPQIRREGDKVFWKLVLDSPWRYTQGVARSMLLFIGFKGLESENDLFSELAFSGGERSVILSGPERLASQVQERFTKPGKVGLVQLGFAEVNQWFQKLWIILLIHLFAIFGGIFMALRYRDPIFIALPLLAISFYLVHAIPLLSIDRYAFPGYLLMIGQVAMAIFGAQRGVQEPSSAKTD